MERSALVSRLVRLTLAPETSAPEGSFTVPRTVDDPVWLQLGTANNKPINNTQ